MEAQDASAPRRHRPQPTAYFIYIYIYVMQDDNIFAKMKVSFLLAPSGHSKGRVTLEAWWDGGCAISNADLPSPFSKLVHVAAFLWSPLQWRCALQHHIVSDSRTRCLLLMQVKIYNLERKDPPVGRLLVTEGLGLKEGPELIVLWV